MGIIDRIKSLATKHDDKVDKGLQKAGETLNQKTGGKYGDQIDKAVNEAQRRTGPGDQVP